MAGERRFQHLDQCRKQQLKLGTNIIRFTKSLASKSANQERIPFISVQLHVLFHVVFDRLSSKLFVRSVLLSGDLRRLFQTPRCSFGVPLPLHSKPSLACPPSIPSVTSLECATFVGKGRRVPKPSCCREEHVGGCGGT